MRTAPVTPGALENFHPALSAAEGFLIRARESVAAQIAPVDRIDTERLNSYQDIAHSLSWVATYVEALRQLLGWADALAAKGQLRELELHIVACGFGEYLAQLAGGIPMSQGEFARPSSFGLSDAAELEAPAARNLIANGNTPVRRKRIIELLKEPDFGQLGLEPTLEDMRLQIRRFVDDRVAPRAHAWHLSNSLIPDEIIQELGELGVFGITIAEEYGGLGLGKLAMAVVSEELSRGYIGVGSLVTRSEIAAELIMMAGTPAQAEKYLPGLASGRLLPTAVFTEPDYGSDLGAIQTKAVLEGDEYVVSGNKTWITHAARSDLMALLVRTDPESRDHRGLSILLAEKPRGDDSLPFPAAGMSGSEIEVVGYRGMKEYEIAFDQFRVRADALCGGREGAGFRQLMRTFEPARIQTAARAIGVAQNALELALRYAQERHQFGKAILAFPRVHGKLAWMAVETMIGRQLTYFAARAREAGKRCDTEAGMAKLLSARVAWSNADNAVQVHGGNGYAAEFPISRLLLDARILSIFEGAAEIQAHVIARNLLDGQN
jgi:(2S)-methylsuccinyl-CoA dehydrogenase